MMVDKSEKKTMLVATDRKEVDVRVSDLAAGAAFVVAVGAVVLAATARSGAEELSRDDALALARDEAARRAEPLETELARLRVELGAVRDDGAGLARRADDLGRRLDALRAKPVATPPVAGRAPAAEGRAPEDAAQRARLAAELEALRPAVLAGTASADELQRFLQLAREEGLADALVAESERAVEAAPRDTAARMRLADAYITKLLAIPGGPEQGVWGMKAEEQWSAVLAQDEAHWGARRALASSWAMWPEFLGKTPDAVREYEKLVEVQERGAAEAQQAAVYVELARLYRRQGKSERAHETLRRGAERHPGDAALRAALAAEEE